MRVEGKDWDEILKVLPDEWRKWVNSWPENLSSFDGPTPYIFKTQLEWGH